MVIAGVRIHIPLSGQYCFFTPILGALFVLVKKMLRVYARLLYCDAARKLFKVRRCVLSTAIVNDVRDIQR